MSHFTKVATKLKNLQSLLQALQELELEHSQAREGTALTIKGYDKTDVQVMLEIKTGCAYSVGVVLNAENNFEFVADWWGVETYTGVKQEDFINKITRKYAYCTVMERMKKEGYQLVTEEVDKKQNIRLVLRKWQ